ncbi:hypothetical protein HaLaN_10851 [Haematococcus lacustris]|uniref:Uncharacterized protein n=1 Tax=Haematococcus lacustris TaxID=44745 RepID=A0A699YYK4_HAELA|nr:hypothetical protein HaLaN_10851 [Haematococcus lacustris]
MPRTPILWVNVAAAVMCCSAQAGPLTQPPLSSRLRTCKWSGTLQTWQTMNTDTKLTLLLHHGEAGVVSCEEATHDIAVLVLGHHRHDDTLQSTGGALMARPAKPSSYTACHHGEKGQKWHTLPY